MGVEMSIKMSPKQAGKLYQKAMVMEQKLKAAREAYTELTNTATRAENGAVAYVATPELTERFNEALGV